MQRTGWFKSLWNRMFNRAPQPREDVPTVEAPREQKRKKKWFEVYERESESWAHAYLSGLVNYLADTRGRRAPQLVKADRTNTVLHYRHRGHIDRKQVKNRADRRGRMLWQKIRAVS